ncbi:hypothetical protein [Paractinoplanes lichenicola]|uniref:Uncharacterized protein n=1 Tax=Paractinoplanes lichenicola TaxID=2802976 RepID=A0ABS1VLH4_9ACTN|nr:hypothetical protein [Actinoplanes lichenicola]MBL7254984.1 hypothetical protein [Actinoplanes lichenicola]
MRNLIKRTLLVTTLVAAAVGVAAAPASASATSCSRLYAKWGLGGSGTFWCQKGSGYYRTMIYCATNVQGTSGGAYYFGPWNHTENSSIIGKSCPSNKYLIAVGYDLP